MHPDFVKKFGLQIHKIKVGEQKIDSSKLDIIGMVIVFFSIKDEKRGSCFFKEIFLIANISIGVALEMFFLTLNNINIDFASCHLYYRIYIAAKMLLITSQVEMIAKERICSHSF